MKIGVMSDSHDNLPKVNRAVEVFEQAGCEALIHAGDLIAPFAFKAVLRFSRGPVHVVFGNNDGEREGLKRVGPVGEPPLVLETGGRRIVVVHERSKAAPALVEGADVVVYGHDHEKNIEGSSPLWLNPGETFGLLTGKATVAILDTETLDVKFVEI